MNRWLIAIAVLHIIAWVFMLRSWRANSPGYITAIQAGDPSGNARLNFKLHLLMLWALPIAAVVYAGAAFAS